MDDHRLPASNQSRPKYLWEANTQVAEKVKEMVKKNVHEETNPPSISNKITRHTVRLPALSTLPRGFDPHWLDMLCDRHVQLELEQAMVVNWCRSIKTLRPLSVPGAYLTHNSWSQLVSREIFVPRNNDCSVLLSIDY